MPNHCSSSNTFVYYTCMVLLHLQCPLGALPPMSGLRSLSCCLQFLLIPHGSFCVLHATLFISSSVPLHFTSFAATRLLQGWDPQSKHQNQYTGGSPAFTQATPTILTGFHSASLRHPFTSVAFSPPAANYFARRLSPLRLRSACIRTAHSLRPFRLRLLSFTCIVQPPSYPDGK